MFHNVLQTEQIVVLNIDVGDSDIVVHSEPLLVPSDNHLSLSNTHHFFINHAEFFQRMYSYVVLQIYFCSFLEVDHSASIPNLTPNYQCVEQ